MGGTALIVLDTHAWIWWVASPDQLSPDAERAIHSSLHGGGVYLSSISCWEVGMLVKKRRLRLTVSTGEWIARSVALPFLHFVPVDNQIFLRSLDLAGPLHDDPADRVIVATALVLGMPLITRDRRLQDYPHLETIW
ncbi:MAG TPA: type II toxin-antitoxin system VapC family toxin [Thermoanaerobaculia bacterium]|nr:type II toxin-antitoxin system VapC family toxin [Thermoanaerobaculia bacterium]